MCGSVTETKKTFIKIVIPGLPLKQNGWAMGKSLVFCSFDRLWWLSGKFKENDFLKLFLGWIYCCGNDVIWLCPMNFDPNPSVCDKSSSQILPISRYSQIS